MPPIDRDLLLSVDGARIESKTQEEVDRMFRGPSGTKVLVCLIGAGRQKRYVNLTRRADRKIFLSGTNGAPPRGAEGGHIGWGDSEESSEAPHTDKQVGGSREPAASQVVVPKLNFSSVIGGTGCRTPQQDDRGQTHAPAPSSAPPAPGVAALVGLAAAHEQARQREANSAVKGLQEEETPETPRLSGPSNLSTRASILDVAKALNRERAHTPRGQHHDPPAQMPRRHEAVEEARDSTTGLFLRQASGGAVVVGSLEGPALKAGIVAVGDAVQSVEGRNMRGKSLTQIHAEMQSPSSAVGGTDALVIGFRRFRGGVTMDYWVSLPRLEVPAPHDPTIVPPDSSSPPPLPGAAWCRLSRAARIFLIPLHAACPVGATNYCAARASSV